MIEAKEALQSIKQAEVNAKKIVEEANEKAKKILLEAELLANKNYEKIIVNGNEEVEKIIAKAKEEGEIIANQQIKIGLEEADVIRNMEESKLDQAVKIIVERIVQNDGNR